MSTINGYSSSYNSYSQYMSTEALKEKAFKSADSNSDGSISSDEFASFINNGPDSGSLDASSLFTSFDTNGDGTLSSDEMDKGMQSLHTQMESTMNQMRFGSSQTDSRSGASGKTHGHHHGGGMKAMFSKADTSGDGTVDSTEFSDFLSQGPLANSVNAEDAFKKYDTNGDGKLSSDEFKAGMKDLMASMPPPPPPPSDSQNSQSSSSDSSTTSSDSIMSLLDSDGNGVVDSNELNSGLSNADIQKKISAYLKQMSSAYTTQTDSTLSSISA